MDDDDNDEREREREECARRCVSVAGWSARKLSSRFIVRSSQITPRSALPSGRQADRQAGKRATDERQRSRTITSTSRQTTAIVKMHRLPEQLQWTRAHNMQKAMCAQYAKSHTRTQHAKSRLLCQQKKTKKLRAAICHSPCLPRHTPCHAMPYTMPCRAMIHL